MSQKRTAWSMDRSSETCKHKGTQEIRPVLTKATAPAECLASIPQAEAQTLKIQDSAYCSMERARAQLGPPSPGSRRRLAGLELQAGGTGPEAMPRTAKHSSLCFKLKLLCELPATSSVHESTSTIGFIVCFGFAQS